MKDQYDRTIDYLRISITDACNLRCRYCMPEEGVCKRNHQDILSLEELAEILGFVDSAHISKVFLTRIGMNANEFRNTYQNVGNMCHIRDRKDFYALVSYIYRHYSEDLRPKEVGERFHLSPRELNRILLYQVEMGFSEFLNLFFGYTL